MKIKDNELIADGALLISKEKAQENLKRLISGESKVKQARGNLRGLSRFLDRDFGTPLNEFETQKRAAKKTISVGRE